MIKNFTDKTKEIQLLEEVLPNEWGTIGPHFINSMDILPQYYGVKYGLSVFSAAAALETILRGLDIGYGDEVIIADYSDPIDTFLTANVGATPVYCDVCFDTLTLDCKCVDAVLTERTRAIIADLPAGNPCDAKALSAYCKEKGISFIINAGDALGTKVDGISILKYADAAFVDMSQGSAMNIGLAGAVLTDNEEKFEAFYSYHNCGRSCGVGTTLYFDEILGGDFRIDEFQACLIPGRLSLAEQILASRCAERKEVAWAVKDAFHPVGTKACGVSSCSGTLLRFNADNEKGLTFDEAVKQLTEKGLHISDRYCVMHDQPILTDAYFTKLTGSSQVNHDEDYPNSVQAGNTVVYVESNINL